jgi:hypothetical protein
MNAAPVFPSVRLQRLALIPWLVAMLVLQGCGLLARKAKEADPLIDATSKDLVVTATLSKSVYRPGEAVLVTVIARNTTNGTLRVRPLTAEAGPPLSASGSLTFWFGPERTLDRFQRYPVISNREARSRGVRGNETIELKAGEEIQRQFLLTRITRDPGRLVFQVRLEPFSSDELKRIGKFYSEPTYYEVYGAPLFRRDSKGIIELEEAVRLATAEAPGEIHLVDAVLIEDEMGFYRWWVNVDYEKPSGGLVQTAYLIDPYIGRVWSDAKQFESGLKRDARRVRYDEMRRMRERALQNSLE